MLSILLSFPSANAQDAVVDTTVLPEEHAATELVLGEAAEAYFSDQRERVVDLEALAETAEMVAQNTGVRTAYSDQIRYEPIGDLVNDPWNSRLLVWIAGERYEMAAEDSDGDGEPNLLYDEDGNGFLRWYLPELSGTGQCLSVATGVAQGVEFAPANTSVVLSAEDFADDAGVESYSEVDLVGLGLDFVVESESADSYNGGLDKLAAGFEAAGYVVTFTGDGWDVSVLTCLSVAGCERCESNPEAWTPRVDAEKVCPCVDYAEGSLTVTLGGESGGEGTGELEPTAGTENKLGSIALTLGTTLSLTVSYSTNGNQPAACDPLLTPFTRLDYVDDPPDYSGGADDTVDEEDEEEDQDRLGVDEKDDTVVQGGNGSDDDGLDDGEEEDGGGADDECPPE